MKFNVPRQERFDSSRFSIRDESPAIILVIFRLTVAASGFMPLQTESIRVGEEPTPRRTTGASSSTAGISH